MTGAAFEHNYLWKCASSMVEPEFSGNHLADCRRFFPTFILKCTQEQNDR